MPRKYLMSWEGPPHFRWSKMFKGTRYRVFCTDLGIPETAWTKEGSYLAANEWWERKSAELQAACYRLIPHHDRLDELAEYRDAAAALGDHRNADVLDAEIVRVRQLPAHADTTLDNFTQQAIKDFERYSGVSLADVDPLVLRSFLSRDDLHRDRLKRVVATPHETTVGGLVGRWVANVQDEARRGLRSSDGAAALEVCVNHFRDFVGVSNPPDVITADLWTNWYKRCREMVAKRDAADGKRVKGDNGRLTSWSADTAKKVFGVSRSFVKWLWTTRTLAELPRNLTDKSHKFDAEDKDPAVFRTAEVHTLLKAATGVHRLILLLSLNCGMYGKDVADLRKTQIDFEKERITRRRSKTRRTKGVPKVSYKLWPETLALLREHVNKDENEPRALVTKSGKPWVWTETLDGGKKRKSDNVATIFNNLKKRVGMVGPDKSFKVFRKTSASRIGNNERFATLRVLFLGHKPREVADKHYVRAGRKMLDRAIRWLRKTYKLDEAFPATPPTDGK